MDEGKQEAEGEHRAAELETGQDADSQLPVNTLFYGVRGQQVGLFPVTAVSIPTHLSKL